MENAIVKQTFMETSLESIERAKELADLVLASRLAPDHFYEKGPDGKVDYTKGNAAKVMMVAAKGHKLGIDVLTSLQSIIHINGLLTIKGDLAKSLIFASGVLEPGSWKEDKTGSLREGTYEVTVTATRRDNKLTLSRSFSVLHAKRAGLWVDEEKIKSKDGWKWKHSPWYKYPDRMIYYRALGFLVRDLFSDVIMGLYTTEEAMDIPETEAVVIEGENDKKMFIPDKDFAEDRSKMLTGKALEKIDKKLEQVKGNLKGTAHPTEQFFGLKKTAEQPVEEKMPEPESELREKMTGPFTEEGLKLFERDTLLQIIEDNPGMSDLLEYYSGRNTNKKIREIILKYQNGERAGDVALEAKNPVEETLTIEQAIKSFEEGEPVEQEKIDKLPFDDEKPEKESPAKKSNKFDINVGDIDPKEGTRSFEDAKQLFEDILNIAGIDNESFRSITESSKPGYLKKYEGDRERFCFYASIDEVNTFLDSLQ